MTFSRCRIGRATRPASLSIGRMRIVVGRAFGRRSAAKPSELRSGLEAPKDFLDWTAGRTQLLRLRIAGRHIAPPATPERRRSRADNQQRSMRDQPWTAGQGGRGVGGDATLPGLGELTVRLLLLGHQLKTP